MLVDKLCCDILKNRNKKLKKLLKKCDEHLQEELNIIKIIKT